jgi:hypothetical protein
MNFLNHILKKHFVFKFCKTSKCRLLKLAFFVLKNELKSIRFSLTCACQGKSLETR